MTEHSTSPKGEVSRVPVTPQDQYELAEKYHFGNGVEQDWAKAAHWYAKAAQQGFAEAQSNLGCCYENGDGMPKDIAKAVEWYTKAAEQGNAIAQWNLGLCYEKGKGVRKDKAKAEYWFTKATELSTGQKDEVSRVKRGIEASDIPV